MNPKPKKEKEETRNQKGLKRAEKQATRPHDQGRLAKKKLPDRRAEILYLRRKNPTQTQHTNTDSTVATGRAGGSCVPMVRWRRKS